MSSENLLCLEFCQPRHTRSVNKPTKRATRRLSTTTEDIVNFKKNQPVSLEIPDRLFASLFLLATNTSKTVGDYMMNTAFRAQRLMESSRPFLQEAFGAKAIVIESETTPRTTPMTTNFS